MKKISTYGLEKIRQEQFGVFLDVIKEVKNSGDTRLFFESFLSKSEVAYLSQRLDIMRMLTKNFSYLQIKKKINVSNSAVTNANACLEKGGEKLKNIILSYKFTPKKVNVTYDPGVKFPRYPGSIL